MEEKKAKHHGAWCGAIGCTNSKNKQSHLAFHRFPSDPERSKRWVQNSRREDLIGKSVTYLHENIRLCREHFESSQYHANSNRLKQYAVPTLFKVPNPPKPVEVKRPLTVRCEPQPKQPKQDPAPCMDWSGLGWLPNGDEVKENHDLRCQQPTSRKGSSTEVADSHNIKRLRCVISRLRKKNKLLEERIKNVKPTVEQILATTSLMLPPEIQSFLRLQLKLSSVKPKGRRYTEEEIMHSLAIYYHGPKAYKQLRKRFFLPCPRILRRHVEFLKLMPGLHPSIMALLKEKYSGAAEHEKLVVISFDEMTLRPKLTYLRDDDRVEGYEDLGELGKTSRTADHALVFLVRGLTGKWKQPIGFYFSHGPAPAKVIQPLLLAAIRQLREAGFIVAASVCDMGTPNQDLYRKLGVTDECPQFAVDGIPVIALHDVPHLFKCVRNNLLRYDVEVDGERLSWAHITSFYEKDRSRPIRAAPKLSQLHILPDAFKRMSVKLATQVMSQSTAAGMLMYASVGILPPEVIPTANALMRLNNLFDTLNSGKLSDPNPMKRALSLRNERDRVALLEEGRDWITRWRVGNGVKAGCITGLRMTINGVLSLWNTMKEAPLRFLLTKRLNQDGIENLFGVIRMCHGQNDTPDATQFRYAYRKTVVSRILTAPMTSNCEADGDNLLGAMQNIACRIDQPVLMARAVIDSTAQPRVVMDVLVDAVTENCLSYVAGYLARKSEETHRCDQCCRVMCTGETVVGSQSDILIGLKSYTGVGKADVGSLRQPTSSFLSVVRHCYIVAQSQAPTILQESGIARRLIACTMHSPEAARVCRELCSPTILENEVARFVRLQLHVMCRRGGARKVRSGKCNRKLLKVSQRVVAV